MSSWLLFFAALFYGSFFLSTVTDWSGFLSEEGLLTYGAQRWREGSWPYRDFFYLWPPLGLGFHSLVQGMGGSVAAERFLSLLAGAGSLGLVLREARVWLGGWKERAVLAALLFLWSFSLWSVPHVFWFAFFFVALGLRLRENSWWLTGLCIAIAFWFKQNSAIAAAIGLILFLLAQKDWRGLKNFSSAFFLALLVPALAFAWVAGPEVWRPALHQIFLGGDQGFSLSEGTIPSWIVGTPLMVIGVWISSLYLSKAAEKTYGLARLLAIAFASYSIKLEGKEFYAGLFGILSAGAWLGSFLFLLEEKPESRRRVLLWWLPGFGIYLTIFPRADFAHFLIAWPISAALLVWFLGRIPRRYPSIKMIWAFFPAWLLILGGMFFQGRALFLRYFGELDAVGMHSYGMSHQLNQEIGQVKELLRVEGLTPSGPLLVLGNAASLYRLTGFKNITPLQQILPGAFAAAGVKESELLEKFEERGGKFVLEPRDSNLQKSAPELAANLRETYEEIRRFPLYFSVWRKRAQP